MSLLISTGTLKLSNSGTCVLTFSCDDCVCCGKADKICVCTAVGRLGEGKAELFKKNIFVCLGKPIHG